MEMVVSLADEYDESLILRYRFDPVAQTVELVLRVARYELDPPNGDCPSHLVARLLFLQVLKYRQKEGANIYSDPSRYDALADSGANAVYGINAQVDRQPHSFAASLTDLGQVEFEFERLSVGERYLNLTSSGDGQWEYRDASTGEAVDILNPFP